MISALGPNAIRSSLPGHFAKDKRRVKTGLHDSTIAKREKTSQTTCLFSEEVWPPFENGSPSLKLD
jgi:hypothetical protein